MYLLDTDILIDIQRGYAPALGWFAAFEVLYKLTSDGDAPQR
jgi:predicted nucleic acid-binding protein